MYLLSFLSIILSFLSCCSIRSFCADPAVSSFEPPQPIAIYCQERGEFVEGDGGTVAVLVGAGWALGSC